MIYPFGDCQTIPEVGMFNITLRNVETHGGFLWPGVIRCSKWMPCSGFVFDNVKQNAWWSLLGWNYFTENVYGTVIDSKPEPNLGQLTKEISVYPYNSWYVDVMITLSDFFKYFSDECVTEGEIT